ncbi:hypothetical protein [Clostridium sp. LS]|uniref:DUF7309 domain-containing protein n=1 Tax=Clostridium sp. LS TaxID=1352601 RepID=UPI0002D71799|nr:hypothetical protein [Clostridium sp. LS]
MCNFGSRDELAKGQLELIKKLGYKFCGKDNWIYFNSHEPGYREIYNKNKASLK